MPSILHYLIFFTFVLVVIPAIGTMILRLALYRYLLSLEKSVRRLIDGESPGEQPRILEKLQRRFKQASKDLDQVNTAALIDHIYSREKVWLLTCEQIDYFCRILPNLLLAFGLLGTFIGITINLTALSETINQTNASNVSDLVAQLQKPLAGMSIAFTTSLIGLLFSAALTVFNWFKNTGLLKYRLISSLEDYLDNVYQPEVQGDTRLDKIVKKMVTQQDEFLTRFGSTVRDAVEQSIGKVAQQIAEGNQETIKLARQVYESFYHAAGTISSAANEFEHTIAELNAKSQIFKQSAEIFERSQFPQQLSTATADLSSTQSQFSQSAASLAATVASFSTLLQEVQSCNQELIKLGVDIKNLTQTSVQVFDLNQSNQSNLENIIPQMKQGANSFSRAIKKLDKLEQKIVDKADSLNTVEMSLQELINSVNQYAERVNSGLFNVSDQLDGNSKNLQNVSSNIEVLTNQISLKLETLVIEMQLIHKGNTNLIKEYHMVGESLKEGMNKLTDKNGQDFNLSRQERTILDIKDDEAFLQAFPTE
ncbi:hypothetical protein Nos7524_3572 [Nostoc sp. PCC 7524]|uniref:hypothetical protein n=1 Tax=Nostoc sp. (strain ATCC 29411 / PCC 7524) TaxID=28072 RepID=UPI00029F37E5|nr:hypothetical protein [Nostoc sp. PCC 7524]AFY49363.1 hypothetical protein Nos7524_3572 [Nostoc sp. PCC 7524]